MASNLPLSHFVQVSKQSPIWEHFLQSIDKSLVKCKHCKKVLRFPGGSTSGFHRHLSLHDISVKVEEDPLEGPSTKLRKIEYFFNKGKHDVKEVVAKLAAKDRLSFRQIVESEEIRKGQEARGIFLPKCHKAARKMVLEFAQGIKDDLKDEIIVSRNLEKKFNISFDEWSSQRRKKIFLKRVYLKLP